MNYRLLLISILGFSAVGGNAFARNISASQFLHRAQTISISSVSQPLRFNLDSTALGELLASGGHIQITDFPGSDSDVVTLDLRPARSPIDSTTQFWEGSSSGAVRIPSPMFQAFRGKVLGEPGSRVFLTAFGGKFLVSITRESGIAYVLGPDKNNSEGGAYVFTRESDLFSYGQFHPMNCIADDIPQPNALIPVKELLDKYKSNSGKMAPLGEPSHSQLLQVDIAVEADSCFYADAGGNMNTVLGYIESLFAMSSTIYEDEVNITWHITWIKVWPSGDPYNVKGNAYALEDTVPAYWRAHYVSVPRDCAHVLTSIGYGGGGFGYYSMCDPNYSYSMSSPQTGHTYPTFAFTYDAYIVAHEVGHNFSLVHSHCCYWDPPLDTCFTTDDTTYGLKIADACESYPITPRPSQGTIMSYCANANYTLSGNNFNNFKLAMTFSHKVDSVLRVNAESAACIVPPANPALILLSPRGSESFPGDSSVTIQWTYANINSVSLEYSPNGGGSWSPIAQSLPASDGQYVWTVPNISSKKMLVRAINADSSQLADTSLLFFTVVPASSVATSSDSMACFALSPDPAQDFLTLTGGNPGERISYDIVGVNGMSVSKGEAVLTGNSETRLDISALPNGTYYLRIASPIWRVISFIHTK